MLICFTDMTNTQVGGYSDTVGVYSNNLLKTQAVLTYHYEHPDFRNVKEVMVELDVPQNLVQF